MKILRMPFIILIYDGYAFSEPAQYMLRGEPPRPLHRPPVHFATYFITNGDDDIDFDDSPFFFLYTTLLFILPDGPISPTLIDDTSFIFRMN